MKLLFECEQLDVYSCEYLEGKLHAEERQALEAHLQSCARCREELQILQAMHGLLSGSLDSRTRTASWSATTSSRLPAVTSPPKEMLEVGESQAAASDPTSLLTRLGAAPWWAVSVALHLLVIVLLGLITMTIGILEDRNSVVVLTNLEKMASAKPLEEAKKSKQDLRDILESKHDIPATDPNSTVQSNIIVPPDILAKAEVGDHFETINLDRPDTQSAFGNPEARMFHSASGNDEPEGGGGLGGASLMDDLIGAGGSTSPGTGGGWGGGNGTGTGIGNGSGHGSFGNRSGGGRKLMVMRHGGSKATESAVDKALEWLARHQEADGHWDCGKYEGGFGAIGDVGVTGLAQLAFLGAGHSEKVGKYKDNVKRSTEWLIKGLKGGTRWHTGGHSNYSQGISAMALAEAAAMSRTPEGKEAAQRAVRGVTEGQIKTGESEYQAWDYCPGGTCNDTSVTGWNILALKSAKVAGLQIDPASFEGALNWIRSGQDMKGAPKDGEADYWEGGKMTYRGLINGNPNPPEYWQAVTAIAACTRLFVGGEKPSAPGVAGPCNLMRKPEYLPLKWMDRWWSGFAAPEPGDLYYWYYGTLAMFQKGGDHWKEWNQAMKKTLIENQRKDGDFDGSWNPSKGYGGRVMSTALGAMCLEVYYRYLPLYR